MEINVEQPGYSIVTSPDTITSGGLGPCSSVGAIYYDRGYLSHDVYLRMVPINGGLGIDGLLGILQREVQDKERLKIFVVGAGSESNEDGDDLKIRKEDRKITLDKIANAGFKDRIIRVEWNNNPDSTQALTLDPGNNVAFYEEYLDIDPEGSYRIHPMQ
jgi:hypothetical protein